MAHSNRERIRADRGGKTKHQANKSGNRPSQNAQDRIKELDEWMAKKGQVQSTTATSVRVKRHNMFTSTRNRRIGAMARLQKQIDTKSKQPKGTFLALELVELTTEDTSRINKEINTLQKRI